MKMILAEFKCSNCSEKFTVRREISDVGILSGTELPLSEELAKITREELLHCCGKRYREMYTAGKATFVGFLYKW